MSRIDLRFRQIHLDFHTSECMEFVLPKLEGHQMIALMFESSKESGSLADG